MQGGGAGDQEKGFIFRHFSDFSVIQMRNFLECHVVVWNIELNSYASWNNEEGDYTKLVTNNGVQYTVERDIEVISIMASASAVTPQANLIYPPIGPYVTGLIDIFDPTIDTDREKAKQIFCGTEGCDVSLQITQGGQIKTYMLNISMDLSTDPLQANSFHTRAINLRAADGIITKAELLNTPDAELNGLPVAPEILDTWGN